MVTAEQYNLQLESTLDSVAKIERGDRFASQSAEHTTVPGKAVKKLCDHLQTNEFIDHYHDLYGAKGSTFFDPSKIEEEEIYLVKVMARAVGERRSIANFQPTVRYFSIIEINSTTVAASPEHDGTFFGEQAYIRSDIEGNEMTRRSRTPESFAAQAETDTKLKDLGLPGMVEIEYQVLGKLQEKVTTP